MKENVFIVAAVLMSSLAWAVSSHAGDLEKALMNKTMKNDTKAVAELIRQGVDINYQDATFGNTALIMACNYGFVEVAELLVRQGADVNQVAMNGATALFGAARLSKPLVELLLEKGAKIKPGSPEIAGPFTTSIIRAITEGETDIAELLLQKGADVDEAAAAGNMAGHTPLMMAIIQNNLDVVKFLVEKGANVNAQAPDGVTPLGIALGRKDKQIVKYLKKHGAKKK